MTRRPKLSLSSNNYVEKTQPPGFETAIKREVPKTTPHPATPPSATEASPEGLGHQDPVIPVTKAAPQTTAPPSGKQLVKVILVVVAAALSLYLLKRRFL